MAEASFMAVLSRTDGHEGRSRPDADHMLMEAGPKRLLPWSHIGKVEKKYQKSNPARQLHALNKFREIIILN